MENEQCWKSEIATLASLARNDKAEGKARLPPRPGCASRGPASLGSAPSLSLRDLRCAPTRGICDLRHSPQNGSLAMTCKT